MEEIVKILSLMAFSAVKFVFAVPSIVLSGYSFRETILISSTGGLIGFFSFFYFGELLKNIFNRFMVKKSETVKKKFTRKNRFIINIKGKYGLIGLSILSPSILSIPLGALLAARYFDGDKRTIPYMCIAIFVWSFVFASIYHFF